MKNLFMSLLGLIVLTAAPAPKADAQLVKYQFTGTKIYGSDGIGTTIAGSLTLDVGAAPVYTRDYTPDYGCGESALWMNGGFSIDGMTDSGLVAGTSQGGETNFWNTDVPCMPWNRAEISSRGYDGIHAWGLHVYSYDYVTPGDGIANVPNPWDPHADQYQFVYLWVDDSSTGVYEYGSFTLDTFTLEPTTIIIDGCDTGIDDFEYQGELVSEHLADCAAGAKNHGHYVSCVAKLTNDLKKAGLLTGEEKGVIMECAAKSNIGK